ncbi:Zinc finger CCCH domain-containing protein 38 [Camellia lanceoleosa]|uniref:Zinc finger CCCH domain-containing protein 38 n=1 Tax=Camellia lanceoleosa TaxID=1840588 RepID=A0ACC0HEJ6_9ERIC|nr:Zinc finger CCCH domain-containing protein 38 [Camellia lanceoleosa]
MLLLIFENVCFDSKPSSREEDAGYAFSLELRKETSDYAMSSIDRKFSADVRPGQNVDQNDRSSSAVIDPLLSKPNDGEGNRPELSSEIPPAQNIVNRQQPSQFINFSALSQLYGDMKQRSHLRVVPNPTKLMGFVSSSLSNSAGPIRLIAAASINPNLVIRSETQYNPLSDNIVLIKNHTDNPLIGLLPNPVEGIVGEKQEVPSRDLFSSLAGGPSGGDQYKVGKSDVELDRECHQLAQLNPVANCDGEGNNEMTVEESKKAQGNRPLEKMNKDSRADEVKKNNDSKGIWVFKFALVEFVKEMLKPKWKEGQISKESHKAILKKVVNNVIGSIQGAYIPDSQEKIDNYLSSSKQKLTQLVEASANNFCFCSCIIFSVAFYFDKNIFSL